MTLYCSKCGWPCGEVFSLFDDVDKSTDPHHVCKSEPSPEWLKLNPWGWLPSRQSRGPRHDTD